MYETLAVAKMKSEKKFEGLCGTQAHDHCNTGAALFPLELIKPTEHGHWIRNIPVNVEDENLIVNI